METLFCTDTPDEVPPTRIAVAQLLWTVLLVIAVPTAPTLSIPFPRLEPRELLARMVLEAPRLDADRRDSAAHRRAVEDRVVRTGDVQGRTAGRITHRDGRGLDDNARRRGVHDDACSHRTGEPPQVRCSVG
jgi:hypothetical protein